VTKDQSSVLRLSQFISSTLEEIILGVEEARNRLRDLDTNAEVCPTGLHYAGDSPGPFVPGRGFVQEVVFDVAITVSEEQVTSGAAKARFKIGVPAWLAGAEGEVGGEHERQTGRSKISRVTFRVPVLLPSTEAKLSMHGTNQEL